MTGRPRRWRWSTRRCAPIYDLFGAADRVQAVRITAEHNYNKDSREAMYAWMARWLQHAPADAKIPERSFSVEPLQDLLVFHRPSAAGGGRHRRAVDRRLDCRGEARVERRALSRDADRVLACGWLRGTAGAAPPKFNRTVLLAHSDPAVGKALASAGYTVKPIAFTPFDVGAAIEYHSLRHLQPRQAASQRIADIVRAARDAPGAAIVADGDAALAAFLARAVVPIPASVLDVGRFDTSSDAAYIDRLYIPGLRRAGIFKRLRPSARGRWLFTTLATGFSCAASTLNRE